MQTGAPLQEGFLGNLSRHVVEWPPITGYFGLLRGLRARATCCFSSGSEPGGVASNLISDPKESQIIRILVAARPREPEVAATCLFFGLWLALQL